MGRLELSGTIELIYEAAQAPTHWLAALDQMARLLRADVASLYRRHEHGKAPLFLGVYGAELAAAALYGAQFVDLDRRSLHMLGRPVGEVYRDEAQLALSAIKDCPAQNDFYRAQLGVEYVLGCHFEAHGGGTFSAFRTSAGGNFEQSEVDLASLILMPHVRRAFKIQRHLTVAAAGPWWSAAALDALPTALFIVDQGLRVVAANRAAETLLAANKGLMIRRSVLTATIKKDVERLNFLVRLSWAERTLADPLPPPIMWLSVPPGLQLMISPVTSPSVLGAPLSRLSFVFVADPTSRRMPPERLLMALHGLTPGEAGVTMALASGRSLKEFVDDKKITVNTARTLLKRAMAKVGAHSQGQLVAQVMSGFGALAGGLIEPPG